MILEVIDQEDFFRTLAEKIGTFGKQKEYQNIKTNVNK